MPVTMPDPLTFAALFELTPHASIAVLADAPNFTIIAASGSYLRLAENTREQLAGKRLLETSPFCDLLSPERMVISTAFDDLHVSAAGQPAQSRTLSAMFTFNSDREPWGVAFAPVYGGNGRALMLILTLEQAAGKDQQKVSAASTRSPKVESIDSHVNRSAAQNEPLSLPLPSHEVFDQAVPGFAVFDLDGNIIDCNPSFAKLVGRSREELQTINSAALIHPEDLGRSARDMERLVTGKSSAFVIEKRYVRPDGGIVWVRNSVSLIRATGGHPPQLVTISEDLTLFRLAEHALIKNEKLAAVGRLSASIAHELNNPLEAVTNLLFLIGHASEMDEVHRYARLAEQELVRVTQIATQTLRFYRHEAAPAPIQMADVLESVLALFEGRLRRLHVKVVKRYLPSSDPLRANSGEIRQVFVNLISNALDAMDDTGRLRIDVRPSRSWEQPEVPGVRVTISDSGSGIPREMLKKIFEPFVSTKESNGTGLGLWISKEIVHRHGGTLRVRSAVSGQRRGTAMSVFLPSEVISKAA